MVGPFREHRDPGEQVAHHTPGSLASQEDSTEEGSFRPPVLFPLSTERKKQVIGINRHHDRLFGAVSCCRKSYLGEDLIVVRQALPDRVSFLSRAPLTKCTLNLVSFPILNFGIRV